MKIGIIVGSHRLKSESTKTSKFVDFWLKKKGLLTYILDLRKNPLPLWDETKWENDGKLTKFFKPYSDKLKECAGFVIIAPEWSGMVPAGLKNFFLYCDKNELSHKPAMIIGISSGRGGHYPVAELRMSSYKNTKICYIPDHVVVAFVEEMLNDFDLKNGTDDDQYIKNRIVNSLNILASYSKAFIDIRKTKDLNQYPNGM